MLKRCLPMFMGLLVLWPFVHVSANEATNTYKAPFKVSSDLLATFCYPSGKTPKKIQFQGDTSLGDISMSLVCLSREPDKKPGQAVRYFLYKRGNDKKVIDAFLGSFVSSKDQRFSYESVDPRTYPEYKNLEYRKVMLASGGNVTFAVEEAQIASGQKTEVYYVVLYINGRVYRHYAFTKLSVPSSKTLDVWVVFFNNNFTDYEGVPQGQNDTVNEAVESILSGFKFTGKD